MEQSENRTLAGGFSISGEQIHRWQLPPIHHGDMESLQRNNNHRGGEGSMGKNRQGNKEEGQRAHRRVVSFFRHENEMGEQ
eukprot:15175029-Ditylum_brightwellii.AAC.1